MKVLKGFVDRHIGHRIFFEICSLYLFLLWYINDLKSVIGGIFVKVTNESY